MNRPLSIALATLACLAGCSSQDAPTVMASGGMSISSGGTSISTGGTTTGSGGTTASSGGTTASSGGTTASSGGTTAPADAMAPGACTVTTTTVECRSAPVFVIATGADSRRVYSARPSAAAPPGGFPAVVLFQGSFYGPATSWDVALARGTTPFGGDVQVELVDALVAHGFVVIQPEAQNGVAWNTNGGSPYESTPDAVFMPKLFGEMERGTFGDVDPSRLYATGISSGGYMTSRMAVSYAGRFRALAIESGSYATCLGPVCTIPATLPADHPPTLFLHGAADGIVPIGTARSYFSTLQSANVETRFVEDPGAAHEWIARAPAEVLAWFQSH